MPRTARIKNNESVVYIIVKGTSDMPLFRDDEDKDYYLKLLNHNRNIYGFRVYAYCIMQDFAHFIIDLCGSDISNIMSSINGGYSRQYNRKYDRYGHVFYDRFRSKIIRDELELKALTLYIHNSPLKSKNYKRAPEKYSYSSLCAFMGNRDLNNLVDVSLIKKLIGKTPEDIDNYYKLIPKYDDLKLIEEVERSSKTSNSRYYSKKTVTEITPEEIINFITGFTGISRLRLCSKHVKEAREARALAAFLMKYYCNYKNNDICSTLGYSGPANISKLFNLGLDLVDTDATYKIIVDEFKKKFAI